MDYFSPHRSLPYPSKPAESIFSPAELLWPAQGPCYHENIHYASSVPLAADTYRPCQESNPAVITSNIYAGCLNIENFCSRGAQSQQDFGVDYLVPTRRPLPISHRFEACTGINTIVERAPVSFGLDSGLEPITPPYPTRYNEDLVDVAAGTNSWSMSGEVRMQSSNLGLQGCQDSHNLLGNLVEAYTMKPDHQYQHSEAGNDSALSYNGFNLPEHCASPTYPLIDSHVQPVVLEVASAKPKQEQSRTVGSLAIVRASRKRRGVDLKSGAARKSRFYCLKKKCVELGIDFTSKQNYDDHLRRHA
ncbi:hypothetical protein GYMLUDRAFT_88923, partial [Collybiopsis luxurians FD-317 M1]